VTCARLPVNAPGSGGFVLLRRFCVFIQCWQCKACCAHPFPAAAPARCCLLAARWSSAGGTRYAIPARTLPATLYPHFPVSVLFPAADAVTCCIVAMARRVTQRGLWRSSLSDMISPYVRFRTARRRRCCMPCGTSLKYVASLSGHGGALLQLFSRLRRATACLLLGMVVAYTWREKLALLTARLFPLFSGWRGFRCRDERGWAPRFDGLLACDFRTDVTL
jgi:hypothetical protein